MSHLASQAGIAEWRVLPFEERYQILDHQWQTLNRRALQGDLNLDETSPDVALWVSLSPGSRKRLRRLSNEWAK